MPDMEMKLTILGAEVGNDGHEELPLEVGSLEFFDLVTEELDRAVRKVLDRSLWVKSYRDIEFS